MRWSLPIVTVALCVPPLSGATLPVIPGDSARGANVFQNEQCVHCHAVNGKGGKIGVDLGRAVPRNYSPAYLASTMWNHGPTMWAAIESAGIERPQLTQQAAADLFAFFYSARFFEKPGSVAAGKATFEEKRCAVCHGITESRAEGAPPVKQWESLADPILLAQQMWNHSFHMRQAFARRKLEWQSLTAAQLEDILSYLRSLPETAGLETKFSNTSGVGGERIFREKGCINCHAGKLALEDRLHNMTLTDIAVDMWNHAPRMAQTPPSLSPEEMRQLLSFLWMRQFVYPGGDIAAGKRVFYARACAVCHISGRNGAPPLPGQARKYSEVAIISALWLHGPQMLHRMKQIGMAWPRFANAQEVANLTAYLNSIQ